jgi:RsiW-degrading membrane proteinase PrsW (M82 family)
MTALLARTGLLLLAAYALILVAPFVFLRLLLGRRPFAGLPRRTLLRFLALGAASAALAVLVNWGLAWLGLTAGFAGEVEEGLPLWQAVVLSFLLAGVVEEGAKLVALRAGLAACPDHATLLMAGLLVGVGFGIVENLANVQGAASAGAGALPLGVAFVRSFVLLHPVATALAADGLGRRAFGPHRWASSLWRGYALAVLVHGLWDVAVFWQPEGVWVIQGITFPWLIWWGSRVASDRVLRLSGRAPARVAARRPAWAGATLIAFGLLYAQTFVESVRLLGGAPAGGVTIYGLPLGEQAASGLAAYNLALSAAGFAGVTAMAARRRWGVWLYAAGAATGLATELAIIGLAATSHVLAFSAAELSDDLAAVASALLFLSAAGRRALASREATGRELGGAPGGGLLLRRGRPAAATRPAPVAPGGS